jgi:DNA invertase Pin-like site-specific DNA recombinase
MKRLNRCGPVGLAKAINFAERKKAVLVVAKLDRISRKP